MPSRFMTPRALKVLLIAVSLSTAAVTFAGAQTQEPKPKVSPTPQSEQQPPDDSLSGVTGNAWIGPNWDVGLTWDPAAWTVEDEFIQTGYDGLQIGTPRSTVFIEAYDGFAGDAAACLSAAEDELRNREGVSEVAPLTGRPVPVPEAEQGAAQLFGVTATLADGTPYRGIEYTECRTLVPGTAVVEITWQGVVGAFNEDLPLVTALLASLELPATTTPAATPVPPLATPGALQATPVA